MKARHVAVALGLALSPMSEVARADIIYDVNYSVQGYAVTGFVKTDGHEGPLGRADILSYDFSFGTSDVNENNSQIYIYGAGFGATKDAIFFNFDGYSFAQFDSGKFGAISFFSDQGLTADFYLLSSNGNSQLKNVARGTSLTIATVAAVPLPSSAPLFGAALVGLGAACREAKRRKSAAA